MYFPHKFQSSFFQSTEIFSIFLAFYSIKGRPYLMTLRWVLALVRIKKLWYKIVPSFMHLQKQTTFIYYSSISVWTFLYKKIRKNLQQFFHIATAKKGKTFTHLKRNFPHYKKFSISNFSALKGFFLLFLWQIESFSSMALKLNVILVV